MGALADSYYEYLLKVSPSLRDPVLQYSAILPLTISRSFPVVLPSLGLFSLFGCLCMGANQAVAIPQVWILKGRNDNLYKGMWVRAMDEMLDRLMGYAENDQLQYVGDLTGYVSAPYQPVCLSCTVS
jgi:hypothetical protein